MTSALPQGHPRDPTLLPFPSLPSECGSGRGSRPHTGGCGRAFLAAPLQPGPDAATDLETPTETSPPLPPISHHPCPVWCPFLPMPSLSASLLTGGRPSSSLDAHSACPLSTRGSPSLWAHRPRQWLLSLYQVSPLLPWDHLLVSGHTAAIPSASNLF